MDARIKQVLFDLRRGLRQAVQRGVNVRQTALGARQQGNGTIRRTQMTRIRGGRLLLVTCPYADLALRFKSVHEQLDQFWQEQGIPHLDLKPTVATAPHNITARLAATGNAANHPHRLD